MEILIFAFVAGLKLYRSKEKFVPETYPFQPLDVQALKQVYNNRVDSSSRLSDRRKSYAVQALS
jgi:hypothetical protein